MGIRQDMSTTELLHILRTLDLHGDVMDLALLPPAFILTWVERPVFLEPVTIHFEHGWLEVESNPYPKGGDIVTAHRSKPTRKRSGMTPVACSLLTFQSEVSSLHTSIPAS